MQSMRLTFLGHVGFFVETQGGSVHESPTGSAGRAMFRGPLNKYWRANSKHTQVVPHDMIVVRPTSVAKLNAKCTVRIMAHVERWPNLQTGMPSRFALSARLAEIPDPGKAMRPMGSVSRIWSLRRNGAALPWRVQSGLNTI